MISIQYRNYNFKFKQDKGKKYIFDEIRRKYVLLSPEEWVRQNFLHYLIYDLGYSKNKMAIEKEFVVNRMKKRFDILIYDNSFKVFMLIECKAAHIKIDNKTAKQIFNYNISFDAPYLVLTNGMHTYCLGKEKKWEEKIPLIP